MRYKLIIFDFDGTLADSFPWFARVINEVADRYRFRRVEGHESERLRGMNPRELMRHLGIPAWKVPLIANHMRKRVAADIDDICLFDGVGPMLAQLSDAGIALALVTSNSETNARAILGKGNAELIKHYECGASLFGKPAKFRKVLRKSGITALESICIGDEVRDCEAARSEGIAFGAVTWGYAAVEALTARAPDFVFNSMDDIARQLTS